MLWWRYILQIPGLPKIGSVSDAEVVAVQAFGRNTFIDADLANIRVYHDQHGGDDAVTIAWLWEHNFDPGHPNRQLALETRSLLDRWPISAIVQWEVAAAFDRHWYAANRHRVICLWPSATPGEYFSTRDVKMATVRIMDEHGWRQVIELAHRRHVVRAYLILRQLLGHDPIAVTIRTDGFDHKSVQPWTTSWYRWAWYEFLVRLHHLAVRWV